MRTCSGDRAAEAPLMQGCRHRQNRSGQKRHHGTVPSESCNTTSHMHLLTAGRLIRRFCHNGPHPVCIIQSTVSNQFGQLSPTQGKRMVAVRPPYATHYVPTNGRPLYYRPCEVASVRFRLSKQSMTTTCPRCQFQDEAHVHLSPAEGHSQGRSNQAGNRVVKQVGGSWEAMKPTKHCF